MHKIDAHELDCSCYKCHPLNLTDNYKGVRREKKARWFDRGERQRGRERLGGCLVGFRDFCR